MRKVILEEKPNLTLADDVVKEARAMLWGGWEGNWLGYNYAHAVRLPGSTKAPVPFPDVSAGGERQRQAGCVGWGQLLVPDQFAGSHRIACLG